MDSTYYNSIDVELYLPLVNKIVYQLNIKESTLINREDLISIGVMGLLEATKKYNAQKNASFETYARVRIRGAILDELRRVGVLSRERMSAVKQYYLNKEKLSQILLKEPSDEELCEYMNISQQELSKIYLSLHHTSTLSLNQALYQIDDEQEVGLMDLLESKESTALEKIEKDEQFENLVRIIDRLEEREKLILQFYYFEELSLAQMSEILNLSVSRISQLHGKAISKIRQKMYKAS